MSTIKLSNNGLAELKKSEALRLKPYKDTAGKWTIGYGHLINTDTEKYLLRSGGITQQKADDLLRGDLTIAEEAVNRLVSVPISGNQFDALVSFVYNIGVGAFSKSTLLRVLNSGDYLGASRQFTRWKFAGGKESAGLLARRMREQKEFLV